MKRRANIMSIFGEMECLVVQQMIAEDTGVVLLAPTPAVSLDDIPESTRYNEYGDKVRIVVVMPRSLMKEYRRRVENMRQ